MTRVPQIITALIEVPRALPTAVAALSETSIAVSCIDGSLRAWNDLRAEPQVLRVAPATPLLALCRVSQSLIAACSARTIYIWNVQCGCCTVLGEHVGARFIVFSPPGYVISCSSDGSIQRWKLSGDNGQPTSLKATRSHVLSACWCSSETLALITSDGNLQVCNHEDGNIRTIHTFPDSYSVPDVICGASSSDVVAVGSSGLYVCGPSGSRLYTRMVSRPDRTLAVFRYPTGHVVEVSDSTLHIWSLTEERAYKITYESPMSGNLVSSCSGVGRTLVCAETSGRVYVGRIPKGCDVASSCDATREAQCEAPTSSVACSRCQHPQSPKQPSSSADEAAESDGPARNEVLLAQLSSLARLDPEPSPFPGGTIRRFATSDIDTDEHTCTKAHFRYALCLEFGLLGGATDPTAAAQHYRVAADLGNTDGAHA